MLEEYKEIYRKAADKIPDWDKINKNELCNLYLDEPNKMNKEAYLSAIIYKYWSHISKFYEISKSIATEEDVYEWLIDSIIYALEHASWRRPDSTIYNDPTGPDKVINRCMKCRRFTFYQAQNRKKRKDGFGNISLDEIQENFNENSCVFEDASESNISSDYAVNAMIKKCFMNQKYITAFIIDNIAYGNTFKLVKEIEMSEKEEEKENKKLDKEAIKLAKMEEKNPNSISVENFNSENNASHDYYTFSTKLLTKRIKNLSLADADYFAHRYQLPLDTVKNKLIKYCIGAKDDDIKRYIKFAIDDLKINLNRGNFDADRFSESR